MNVNEILLRIQHRLPRTNYEPAAIRRLIRKIDGIDISESALRSRVKKIVEAYRRIQQESQIRKNLQESRHRRDPAVPSERSSTVSYESDDSSHRLAPRGQQSFEKALSNNGAQRHRSLSSSGPKRHHAVDQEYLAQLFYTVPGSALETLKMIIHRQTLGRRPDQYHADRRQPDTYRGYRPQPVQYHPNSALETLRRLYNKQSSEHHPELKTTSRHHPTTREERLSPKTKMSNVEAWRKHSALHYASPSTPNPPSSQISHYRSSQTVGLYRQNHLQHVHKHSTSTKRGLEQPSATQPAKRPRPNPGAYAFKHSLTHFDESDICSDSSESTEGSEYCD